MLIISLTGTLINPIIGYMAIFCIAHMNCSLSVFRVFGVEEF